MWLKSAAERSPTACVHRGQAVRLGLSFLALEAVPVHPPCSFSSRVTGGGVAGVGAAGSVLRAARWYDPNNQSPGFSQVPTRVRRNFNLDAQLGRIKSSMDFFLPLKSQ